MKTCAGKSSLRPFQNTWPHSCRPLFHKAIRVQSWPFGGGVRVTIGDPEVLGGWDSEWRSQSDPVNSPSSLGAVTPSCLIFVFSPNADWEALGGYTSEEIWVEKEIIARNFFSVVSNGPSVGYVVHGNNGDAWMRFETIRYLERSQTL